METLRAAEIALALALAWLCSSCGEPVNCWCRCPPHDNAYEFSVISSTPPTCDEVCAQNECRSDPTPECSPDETQSCGCAAGRLGVQVCNDSGYWGSCVNCTTAECEEGEEDLCECLGGGTGGRVCDEYGAWGAWEGCPQGCVPEPVSRELSSSVSGGDQGMTSGGREAATEFDTSLWGCDDGLIWRLPIRDGAALETLYFELTLPADVLEVVIDYHHLTTTDGVARSELEIVINGVNASEVIEPTEGCVEAARISYLPATFNLGALNRVEVWSRDNGSGLPHGFQGITVNYLVPGG